MGGPQRPPPEPDHDSSTERSGARAGGLVRAPDAAPFLRKADPMSKAHEPKEAGVGTDGSDLITGGPGKDFTSARADDDGLEGGNGPRCDRGRCGATTAP
jgi:hypothetical protein